MLSAALKCDENELTDNYSQERLDEFVQELSDLCRRYKLGITGSPTLFVMEPTDNVLSYAVDKDSNLALC